MPLVNVDDIAKVVMRVVMPNVVTALNIFYWQCTDPNGQNWTQAAEEFANAIDAIYFDVQEDISDECTFGPITVYKLVGEVWNNMATEAVITQPDSVSDMLPHGVAAIVRAYGDQAGVQARKFIPGFDEGSIIDSTWESPALVNLAAFADQWVAELNMGDGASWDPGTMSEKWAGFVKFSGAVAVNTLAGYQRRRKPGVGT